MVPAQSLLLTIEGGQQVSALLQLPERAVACYVLAHGAGAGMRHAFMSDIAARLAERHIGTLRYQFAYMESGSRRPDPPPICHATVRAAAAEAARRAPGVPLLAGGKSFGGRMTSQAQALSPLERVRGLMFLGFPLHAAKKPASDRAKHLADVNVPMLFLQGTRDELADLALLEPIIAKLAPRATLKRIEDADHSFHVRARGGRTDAQALDELADTCAAWVKLIC